MGPLPSYKKPPVVETVLSVQFAPLDAWGIPHFGLFWQEIRKDFPKHQTQPPLASEIENYESPIRSRSEVEVEFTQQPHARCWYLSEDGCQLIQLQRDRFIYNWRQNDPEAVYPRYELHVRPAFERNWSQYTAFLKREGLGPCSVVQCEVTYVNHIPKGQGWETVQDLARVFKPLGTLSYEFLPSPEFVRFNLAYPLPERKGRLRIATNHAVRQSDGKQIIVLNMMCRGKPDSSESTDVLRWLDVGREWVVRGFTEITCDPMHKLWGRER